MTDERLEIALNGKRYVISCKTLHNDVKSELQAVFTQELEPLALLKLYIAKAQEYALICQSLEHLHKSLEGLDSPLGDNNVQISPL